MSDDFVAIYKCRLCGKKIKYAHAGYVIAFKDVSSISAGNKIESKAKDKILHLCDDGSIGIADFLGYKKEGI